MKPFISLVVLSAGFFSCSAPSGKKEAVGTITQAVDLLTNELQGQVIFTNTGTVAAQLTTIGMAGGSVSAHSVSTPPTPQVNSGSSLTNVSGNRLTGDYRVTLAAGNADQSEDFLYQADSFVSLNLANGFYRLPPAPNPPLSIQQRPDPPGPKLPVVSFNLQTCAGIVDVSFSTPVDSGFVQTLHPAFASIGGPQSGRTFGPVSAFQIPVLGDSSSVQVDTFFTTGTDPFSNTVTRLCRQNVIVNCDEEVAITCSVTGGGGGGTDLGAIEGNIEMLTETENVVSDGVGRTLVQAFSGPFGNGRLFTVPTPGVESPWESSGHFLLRNLLNSDACIAVTGVSTPYVVQGQMSLRKGRRAEFFSTPGLFEGPGGANAGIPVVAGVTTQLGDTFRDEP